METEKAFSKPLVVWLVGAAEETSPILKFITERMNESQEDNNSTKGLLCLKDKVFAIEVCTRPFSEIAKENKRHLTLKVDGIIICKAEIDPDDINFEFYNRFRTWGQVKALCFVDPIYVTDKYDIFMNSSGTKSSKEKDLLYFMNKLTIPKQKIRRTTIDYEGGDSDDNDGKNEKDAE